MDKLEKAIIRKLQEDLPLVKEPYKQLASELGILEQVLLDKIKVLKEQQKLRRMGAILHHRAAGVKANAMVVWQVPEDQIAQVTAFMVSFEEVSHCYQRAPLPDWPYNIYTMIHSTEFKACEAIIKHIAELVHLNHYEILYSTKELKKSSMKYFHE
ncbi:siroheme decarboxylase subunit beta [Cellulosilyticum sp. I15G10I2]|uniref:siroheme decarboxylase subunit beta n=1 Tax=Cellulosilyticum sp. I15G10I2 TaxID=1892843 RepID=UPI00085C3431|nr:Lrp/AsnC family transcriptional regulator [Cellulosilyticum sp. I15G10I2]